MNRNAEKLLLWFGILAFPLLFPHLLRAQATGATVSGAINDLSGKGVTAARVSVKNIDTGQTTQAQADLSGHYTVSDLAPGNYEVSVTAPGFNSRTTNLTISAGVDQTLDLMLMPSLESGTAPTLQDLGLSPGQTQGSAKLQAMLDKRSRMLKIHQRLGLIALAPLVATVITSNGAAGRNSTSGGRILHAALGSASGDLYFMSAYYAIRAPKIPGTETRGQIKLHKALAWVHGPGMILTPILGAIAFDQESHGHKVHGIASAHSEVAIVTLGAYAAAILSVSLKF